MIVAKVGVDGGERESRIKEEARTGEKKGNERKEREGKERREGFC